MNNLGSNLNTLVLLATRIKLSVITFEKILENTDYLNKIKYSEGFYEKVGFQKSLRGLIAEHMIIQFCSFLDEYKKFNPKNIGQEYTEKIKIVRKKNKYGIRRIDQWKNLYDYRNQIAAHNFDIKNKSILSNKEIKEYSIPSTFYEISIFYKICEKICHNIFIVFPEFVVKVDLDIKLGDKVRYKRNLNFDFEEELEMIEKNMN